MRRVWDRRSTGTTATSLAEREDPRHCDTPSVPIPTWVDSIHSWMPANAGSGRTRRASRPRFGGVVSRPCHHDYTNPSLTPGVRHGFVTQLAAGAHLPLLGSRSAIRDRRLFSPNPPEPGAGRIASEQYLAIGWSERPRYDGVVFALRRMAMPLSHTGTMGAVRPRQGVSRSRTIPRSIVDSPAPNKPLLKIDNSKRFTNGLRR